MHGFLLQGEKGFRPLHRHTIIIVFLFECITFWFDSFFFHLSQTGEGRGHPRLMHVWASVFFPIHSFFAVVFAVCVCVCVPTASICPSKQSWQTNLIWPRKGQPHSNCLSLTLCTDAPLPLFFSSPLFLSIPPFFTLFFLLFFVSLLVLSYFYSVTFPRPILFPLSSFLLSASLLHHHPLSLYISLYSSITCSLSLLYRSC